MLGRHAILRPHSDRRQAGSARRRSTSYQLVPFISTHGRHSHPMPVATGCRLCRHIEVPGPHHGPIRSTKRVAADPVIELPVRGASPQDVELPSPSKSAVSTTVQLGSAGRVPHQLTLVRSSATGRDCHPGGSPQHVSLAVHQLKSPVHDGPAGSARRVTRRTHAAGRSSANAQRRPSASPQSRLAITVESPGSHDGPAWVDQ